MGNGNTSSWELMDLDVRMLLVGVRRRTRHRIARLLSGYRVDEPRLLAWNRLAWKLLSLQLLTWKCLAWKLLSWQLLAWHWLLDTRQRLLHPRLIKTRRLLHIRIRSVNNPAALTVLLLPLLLLKLLGLLAGLFLPDLLVKFLAEPPRLILCVVHCPLIVALTESVKEILCLRRRRY